MSSEYVEMEPGRFQAGNLSPAQEADGGQGTRDGGGRWRSLRVFDRALLVAEVASAMVVTWLVAQYIYTVYFDTAPRRVTPPSSAGVVGVISRATPTEVAQVAPLAGTPDMGSSHDGELDAWNYQQGEGKAGNATRTPAPTWTPTPAPTVDPALLLPARLRIPVMFLDSPVHEVTVNMGVWEVSPMDIGHHHGSGMPGQVGNVVLAGHRDINSALFRELDRLKPGDEVFVSNSLGEYKYIVSDSFVVGPDHTEVMDPTDDKRVTLITCTPIGLATQRLIVTAILDESAR